LHFVFCIFALSFPVSRETSLTVQYYSKVRYQVPSHLTTHYHNDNNNNNNGGLPVDAAAQRIHAAMAAVENAGSPVQNPQAFAAAYLAFEALAAASPNARNGTRL
jgi:hypothetical protein